MINRYSGNMFDEIIVDSFAGGGGADVKLNPS